MANDEKESKKVTKAPGKVLKKGKGGQKHAKPFLGSTLTRSLNKSKRPRKKQ